MKKVLKNNIDLKSTLLSGQAFRITQKSDSCFVIVLKDRVVSIKEQDDYLLLESNNEENLEEVVNNYLDLNRDYNKINDYLLNKNCLLKDVIEHARGYKILNQDSFEMIISYIISQNNNVRNISSSIEKLSKKFGKKVLFKNEEYYLFPTFDELKNATIEELNECKLGFRSKYILNMINEIKLDDNYINKINNLTSEAALNKLMKIKGIGNKVASCILLFGFSRFDTFPIDTWVKKYFNEDNIEIIKRDAKEKYGEYSGLVIQYMFHYARNKNKYYI